MNIPNRRTASRFAMRAIGSIIPFLFIVQGLGSVVADSDPQGAEWQLPSWDSLAVTQRESLLSAMEENVTQLGLPFAADWHNATGLTLDDIPAIVPFLFETLRTNLRGISSDVLTLEQELAQAIANTTLEAAAWLRSLAPPSSENSTLPEPNVGEEQMATCPSIGYGGLLAVLCLVLLPVFLVLSVVLLVVSVAVIVANLTLSIALPIALSLANAAIAVANQYVTAITDAASALLASYSNLVLGFIHARLDKYSNPSQEFLTQSVMLIEQDLGTQIVGGPMLQQATWRLPQDNDYSIAWAGQVLYAFGGWKTGDTTHQNRVWRIDTSGQATQLGAQLPSNGGGSWIPVYDGENVYLFGRMGTTRANQALRYNIDADNFQALAFVSPTACCVSASYDGRLFNLFGQPSTPIVLQYDPQTQLVATTTMPIPAGWQEGTPIQNGQTTYYVGGQPSSPTDTGIELLPKGHAGSILRYETTAQSFDALAVAGYHSTVAPPTFALGTDLYVFDGESRNEQAEYRVRRIDLSSLESNSMTTRLPGELTGGLAVWTGAQALIMHKGTVYTYDPRSDSILLDADGAAAAWAGTACEHGQRDLGYQGSEESCTTQVPCAQCGPLDAQRRASIRQGPSTIRIAESVHKDPATIPADSAHDHEGVPQVLQSVYLPSQANQFTTDQDALSLVDGLPGNGFALLIEPGHRQAYLIVADASTTATNFVGVTGATLSAAQALDRVEALQGVEVRNALAMVLDDDVQVHYALTSPDAPRLLNLTWNDGSVPADGSWLLVHTNPTRVLELVLAGNPVTLVARAASHFSAPGATDYRYSFINVHTGDAFCYDPGMHLATTECRGSPWPGWIRTFSGQAAYALDALNAGLASGALPLTSAPPSAADNPLATVQAASQDYGSPLESCPSNAQSSQNIGIGVGGGGSSGGSSSSTSSSSSSASSSSSDPVQPVWESAAETASQAAGCVTVQDIQDLPERCGASQQQSMGVAQIDQVLDAALRLVSGISQAAAPLTQKTFELANAIASCITPPTTCPHGMIGVVFNGRATCLPPPSPGLCPDGTLGLVMNGQPICVPQPTAAPCPTGTIGLIVNDQNACSPPPSVDLCPANQAGVAINGQAFCFMIPAVPCVNPAQPGCEASAQAHPADSQEAYDIFNPTSAWSLLGNKSYAFPTGIGVDYLLDANNPGASLVQQVQDAMLDNGTTVLPELEQRRFLFQGAFYSTPILPRDSNRIRLGIESLDDESGQTFLLDGKRIAELLDIRPGEVVNVTIDDDHREGFQYTQRDVTNDGVPDLIVHIPHFSTAWITLVNPGTYSWFTKVVMTSATTGWITGGWSGSGAVFRYASGQLERYDIPGITLPTQGLHVVSDTEFYAVGGPACHEDKPAFIAHYRSVTLSKNGWVDVQEFSNNSPGYCPLRFDTIWMSADQSVGYTGGGRTLLKFNDDAWHMMSISYPIGGAGCGHLNVIHESTTPGLGRMGFGTCNDSGSIARFESMPGKEPPRLFWETTDRNQVNDLDTNVGYAVGVDFLGPHILRYEAATHIWKLIYYDTVDYDRHSTGSFSGFAQQPETSINWVVGYRFHNSSQYGIIAKEGDGKYHTWQAFSTPDLPSLLSLSFASRTFGLAVGDGVLQFRAAKPPIAAGTLSATSGDTSTTFTANGAGSYSQEPGGVISHQWSWGDGIVSTGETSTHRYNAPSSPTYTVTHLVRDTKYNTQASHTFTVTVNSEPLTVGTSHSDTFTSSTTKEAHHYRIPATAGERFIQVQLTGPNVASRAIARLDGIAGPTGAWPTSGASVSSYFGPSTIAGRIPSNSYLDIKVENLGYGGTGSLAFTISATTLPTPASPTTSLVAGTYNQVAFSATAPHNGNRLTRLMVDWGDGQTSYYPATGYNTAGTTYYPSHDYATPGARTVTISSQDDVGQVASITRAVTIHLPPQGTATGATATLATQATLNGQLSSLGGASSVTAVYKVFNGGTQVAASGSLSATAVGALPTYTVTGLTSGVSYTYTITLTNDVASATTASTAVQTISPLVIVPQIVSNSGSVGLGAAYSLGLKASATHPNNVAYFVRWDTGAGNANSYLSSNEIRYPSTGYVPWNQEVTASRTLAFVGAHAVEIRIEDSLLARSNPTTHTATVTGASPLASFTSASTTTTSAVLSATVGSIGVSAVRLRMGIQDPGTLAWTYNSYVDATAGHTYTWTPTLSAARAYKARVDMYHTADQQSWTTAPTQMITIRTNQAPTLLTTGTPWQVNYLDVARFAVTYADADGDAPSAAPIMTLNGVAYTMHRTNSGADYRMGVEYHYNVPAANLTQGQTYWPTFQVQDQFARTASAQGAGVNVARKELLYFDFRGDAAGGLPQGMASGGEPMNYWHVVDTQAADMPGRLALGHHGKALWFADALSGNYNDPEGGVPRGTMTIQAIDLGQVVGPALSFSSYYETRDRGTWKDVKLVEICTSACGQDSSWSLLHQVSGDEGGYGAWRTQHVSLSQYEGQVVQIRFVFDAIDNNDNMHFGWFIDDIVIGHDHDGDTLPDVLEEMRKDILIAEQFVPVKVQPEQTGASYVRRLIRPYADSFQLEALVSSPAPSSLKVVLGVSPSLEDPSWHNFTLYNGGTQYGSCTTAPDNGVQAFNRSAVLNRGDGLDIRVDLVRCAGLFASIPESVFAEPRNWFLQVTNSDARAAWIDMLRIVTSGRTDPFQFSTNQDGTGDGAKVNTGRDALGHDADQDGITNAIDADDTVPSWAPAFEVSSLDYKTRMELQFHDLAVPLAKVFVTATYNATGQARDLSSQYIGGATWVVNPGQHATLPDVLGVTWQDVYGTRGTITYYMPQPAPETPIYQPLAVAWAATDAATGHVTTMRATFDSQARTQAMPSVVMTTAPVMTPWGDGSEDWLGVALFARVATLGAVAVSPGFLAVAVIVGAVVLVKYLVDEWNADQHLVNRVIVKNNIISGTGLSITQVDNAIKFGSKVQLPGNQIRYVHQVGTMLVVVVVADGPISGTAKEAFKWTLPTSINWDSTSRSVGDMLILEKLVYDAIKGQHVNKDIRTLLTMLSPTMTTCFGQATFVIESTSSQPFVKGGFEQQAFIPLCATIVWETILSYVDTVDAYAFRQDLIDSLVGEATFGHLKFQASEDRFDGEFYWYWDDAPSATQASDCDNSATWAHADIRRCNSYSTTRVLGELDLGDMKFNKPAMCRLCQTIAVNPYRTGVFPVPDVVSVRTLDWASSGVKDFEDAFSSNGYFVGAQNLATNGLDYQSWAIDAIGDEMPDLPQHEGLDADVRVAYFYTEPFMWTRADFRTFGS